MRIFQSHCTSLLVGLPAVLMLLLVVPPGHTHCDTLDGPVVSAARVAFANEDVTPVLKWVDAKDEPLIRQAFAQSLEVRKQGDAARQLAETYFFETLVRVHRAAEGVAFTGLKPAGSAAEPGIQLADTALDSGSDKELIDTLSRQLASEIHARFQAAHAARAHAEESVESGRASVAAYVDFIHYVAGVQQVIDAKALHAHEEAAPVESSQPQRAHAH